MWVYISCTVTDTVLQLGSHDSAIYLFGSHIYLGGMAQDCELNHSVSGCQCTGRSPWITHWKAITQTSKVHCHLISHRGPDQATDWSAMHTLCSLGTFTNSPLPSISPISIPISILSGETIAYHIPRSECDFAFQNSVTLPRLCVKLKATGACFVTLSAPSKWISILLFIALMFLVSCYRVLLCLSYS